MHISSPDEVFTTQEAAEYLGKSPRQVQRLLASGKLPGTRPNGAWIITSLSLWRYLGIADDMMGLWERSLRGSYADDQ